MNLPNIHPQLRKKFAKSFVRDYMFIIRETEFGSNIKNIVDMKCYDDGLLNRDETMKSMSISNARCWWNELVDQGYERL